MQHPSEVSLVEILTPWLREKFPEIMIVETTAPPLVTLYLAKHEAQAYIGSVRVAEMLLWDDCPEKRAGGRFIYYDPCDPKFFEQVFEHLVRIIGKK